MSQQKVMDVCMYLSIHKPYESTTISSSDISHMKTLKDEFFQNDRRGQSDLDRNDVPRGSLLSLWEKSTLGNFDTEPPTNRWNVNAVDSCGVIETVVES